MDAFLAVADPHRRAMVELLAQGRRSAGEIAAKFPISAPAVSQHLKALRETHLVQVEVRGQQRIYTLAPDGFREIDEWLARCVRFWSNRLDRLDAAIARVAERTAVPARFRESNTSGAKQAVRMGQTSQEKHKKPASGAKAPAHLARFNAGSEAPTRQLRRIARIRSSRQSAADQIESHARKRKMP